MVFIFEPINFQAHIPSGAIDLYLPNGHLQYLSPIFKRLASRPELDERFIAFFVSILVTRDGIVPGLECLIRLNIYFICSKCCSSIP